MKELIRRLKAWPFLSFEIGLASLFIGLLGLASPIYIMQVLRRYVSSGIDGTLFTLTTGVLVAIVMEFAFRQVRLRLTRGLNLRPEAELSGRVFATITDARMGALSKVPEAQQREMVSHLNTIQQTYNPINITTLFDVPISLLYLVVVYLLRPAIALLVLCFMVVIVLVSVVIRFAQKKPTQEVQQVTARSRNLAQSALQADDSVRAFNAARHLKELWGKLQAKMNGFQRHLVILQGLSQSLTGGLQALMNVAVIAVGAWLTVRGEMTVAAMIGANILAARSIAPILRVSQISPQLTKAGQSLDILEAFCNIAREPRSGTALKTFAGRVEFSDMAFSFDQAHGPLFESVTLTVPAGGLLVVTGANGTGKTTMASLVLGLLQPTRGRILVDGVELRQVQPEWWRRQIIYMPQEPVFFEGTIRENLLTNGADVQEEELLAILQRVGLKQFLDESTAGLEMMLAGGGRHLALGIRRRIALARALVTKGQLVVIDEPTEGMDQPGRVMIGQIVTELVQEGKTLVICSHNPNILPNRGIRLNLDIKPVPGIILQNPNKAVGPGMTRDGEEE
ncbi:MAG: ATP-binding cassette domain-containing protein [Kiritimatiellae bacterium]|nr:ATP-binding cassette domain-containing protein [Kiritimatiellia bacterium]MDD5519648.1 ATP-binding cassette domain-containing protein [Kiritimatiellia bacterium]